MSSASIIFLAIILIPTIVIVLLRINAVFLFFSLCLGYVLSNLITGDTNSIINLFNPINVNSPLIKTNSLKIIILFIPVIITAMFMLRSVKGRKNSLNILPAIGFSVLGLILVTPFLSHGISSQYSQSQYWLQIVKAKDLVIELVALVALMFLFLERIDGHDSHRSHKSKR